MSVDPSPTTSPSRRAPLGLLLAILVFALALRVCCLNRLVYANPDEALWSYFIVTGAQLSPLSPVPSQNAFAHILSWDYGYPLFVLDYVYVNVLEALKLPVSEATLPLPLAVLGTLNCLLLYLIGRRWHSERAGLFAAALLAITPAALARSRSIGGAEACSGFLLLLTVLQLMRLVERPEDRRRQWLLGLSLGLYLCGDVQFPVGAAVLAAFLLLWPKPEGYGGARGLWRLIGRVAIILPPVILFAPYIPAWLYARHLGYPDQTYLGTILVEHKAQWGFHLIPFLGDLGRNLGYMPLLLLAGLLPWLARRRWADGRTRWLVTWLGLTALPFLIAVTSDVTEASGYHEHLVAGLVLTLGLALAQVERPALRRGLIGVALAGTLLVTLGGLFRVEPLTALWFTEKIPYGGLVPNSGMKTAGYWVRQNLPAQAQVFVAHDPAVSYWYLGREAVTGGYTGNAARKQALLEAYPRVQAIVIPLQLQLYPPEMFPPLGFPGRIIVRSGGAEVLNIYLREPLHLTLDTEQTDPLYNRAYRTSAAIIPPGAPYAPGKTIR